MENFGVNNTSKSASNTHTLQWSYNSTKQGSAEEDKSLWQ